MGEQAADDQPMTTTARPQQRYAPRLWDLVQRTGEMTLATDLGVPRSTAREWLGAVPTVVGSLDVVDLTEPELRQEIVKLRRRVEKLAALLRLALAVLRVSGFALSRFRPVLHRCPGARGPAGAPSARSAVALRAPSVRADAGPCTRLDRVIAPTSLAIRFFLNPCPRELGALYDRVPQLVGIFTESVRPRGVNEFASSRS